MSLMVTPFIAAAIRSDWLGRVSTSTHVSGSDGGTATVKRLATSTSNGRGSPAALALDAQSVALPCGSMSLTSTLRPRRLRARAVQMVLVVLADPALHVRHGDDAWNTCCAAHVRSPFPSGCVSLSVPPLSAWIRVQS